ACAHCDGSFGEICDRHHIFWSRGDEDVEPKRQSCERYEHERARGPERKARMARIAKAEKSRERAERDVGACKADRRDRRALRLNRRGGEEQRARWRCERRRRRQLRRRQK